MVNIARFVHTSSRRLAALAVLSMLAVSACADQESTQDDVTVLDGIGRLPGFDFWAPVTLPDGVVLELPMPEGGPVGARVTGNRVLLVGDSILASTAKRYGNEMCNALKPLGWQVAVEAEPSRFASFGVNVLERRIGAVWDAVIIYLGTNYDGNESNLRKQFEKMFKITRGVDTVVLTTGEFREAQKTVNEVIRSTAADHDHVRVLDWSGVMKLRGVASRDKIHLSDIGRAVLAETIARALDYAPYRESSCLDPRFRDDTGITAQSQPNP
jgi:hypothetical protein